jgi:hypothetical protein
MLTKVERERELEEARQNFEMDRVSSLKDAWLDGFEEGVAKAREQLESVQVGRICTLEQLLGLPLTPQERLYALTLDELTDLADKLQTQLARK